jgi:hypothetical protein
VGAICWGVPVDTAPLRAATTANRIEQMAEFLFRVDLSVMCASPDFMGLPPMSSQGERAAGKFPKTVNAAPQ